MRVAQQAPLRRRSTRPGLSALSLDAASILAPVSNGPLPATPSASAGEASGGGDFAALLESLAGILQAVRSPAEGQAPAPGTPVQAPAGAGLDIAAALALEIPVLPGAPAESDRARLVAGLAFQFEGGAKDAEASSGPVIAETEDADADATDGAPSAVILAALAPLPAPAARITESREAEPARDRGGFEPAAALPLQGAPSVPSEPEALLAGPSADPTPGSPSGGADAPPPSPKTAAALALAPGVLAVTGQRVAAEVRPVPAPPTPIVASDAADEAVSGAEDPAASSLRLAAAGAPVEMRPPEARPAEARASGVRGGEARRRDEASIGASPAAQGDPATLSPAAASPAAVTAIASRDPGPGAPGRPLEGLARGAADEPEDLAALDPARDAAPSTQAPAAAELRSAGLPQGEPPPAPARASAETVAALAAQMARKLDDGVTRFDLELNPGDLGRVDVRLEIDASGAIRAAFTFEDAHAAGELGRRADELQKSLESAGFNLSGGLSFDVTGDRAQGRNPSWADARESRSQAPASPAPESAREGLADISDALQGRRLSARAGVDIRI